MNTEMQLRIGYILHMSRHYNKKPQDVSMAMRVSHNIIQFGKDGSSEFVKKNNTHISEKALNLLRSTDWKSFHKNTVNEHEFPLNAIWEYAKTVNNRARGVFELRDIFANNPIVIVTKEEDAVLRKIKQSTNRYELAGISKVTLEHTAYEEYLKGKRIV